MKTKTIELPDIGVKITIEWKEQDNQFSLPLMGRHMTLHDIEHEVAERVIGTDTRQIHLAPKSRLQHVSDARHVFCVAAHNKYGYSVSAIAKYLKRTPSNVRKSLKSVHTATLASDPSLWAAHKRYTNDKLS